MSNVKRWRVLAGSFSIMAFVGLFAPIFAADRDNDLPRYRLQVGQELTYRGKNEFKYDGGKFVTGQTWKIWVVRANPDQSWRLILRHGRSFKQIQGNDEKNDKDSEDSGARDQITFAWCDFYPDGRIIENDSFGFQMKPSGLLIKLPADSSEMEQGWVCRNTRMDETMKLSASGEPSEELITIAAAHESPMNEIYGTETHDVVTFDRRRGIPERIDSKNSQTYGFNGQGKGSIELVGIKTNSAEFTVQFAKECDEYFQANAAFERATESEDLAEDQLKAGLDAAAAKLKEAKNAIENEELRKVIDARLDRQQQMVSYYLESARKRRAILGTKSDSWETTDLDGNKHALVDYRGKVVILDFWYRGCGWCIRAMPQMKEVATNFADKPVVVFGMNTDQKKEDATFVVEKMRLNYVNLKAKELPPKYNVSGFPTLIILDQKGTIRDLHVGYSPDLKDKVIKSVERLLAEGP